MDYIKDGILITVEKDREYKTTEARRRAVRRYEQYNDRINTIFPGGTKARMKELGIEHPSAFVKQAVLERLDAMERDSRKEEL